MLGARRTVQRAPSAPLDWRAVAPAEWAFVGDLLGTPALPLPRPALALIENHNATPNEAPPERPSVVALRVEPSAPRFTRLPYIEPRTITARPRGGSGSSEWTRNATALERWFEGRTGSIEIRRAMAHNLSAIHRIPSPLPVQCLGNSPRHRPERAPKPKPEPPRFTTQELAEAATMIEAKCKGPLAERAWLELKHPPKRCLRADSLKMKVQRAIQRAERRLRDDACARKRRGTLPDEE